jgi:hypothetical protein
VNIQQGRERAVTLGLIDARLPRIILVPPILHVIGLDFEMLRRVVGEYQLLSHIVLLDDVNRV